MNLQDNDIKKYELVIADLRAKLEAVTREHEREQGLWSEQHAHQHSVNLRLEKERDRLREGLNLAREWLKAEQRFPHTDWK